MDTLLDVIDFFIILCDVAAALRIGYCIIRIMSNPDDTGSYIKKIINMLIFLIMANTCFVSLVLVQDYFGGFVLWKK